MVWLAGLLAAVWVVAGKVPETQAIPRGEYLGPRALAVSKDGKVVYVANADAREVAWVDIASGKVIRRIAVSNEPTGLAITPNGATLIVTCAAPRSTVALLSAESGQRLAAIPAGHTAMSPIVSPDGKRLYVCNRFDNDVSVIDLTANRQTARVRAVREPVAAAVTPDGRAVLVANHLPFARTDDGYHGDVSPVVTVIDAKSLQTTAIELPHGAAGLRGICITPDGRQAIVTHLLSNFQKIPFRVDMGWINVNVVSIIDIGQRKVIRTSGMDEQDSGAANPWDIVCTSDGKTLGVSLSGIHQVCLIERSVLLSEAARTMSPMIVAWPIYPSLGSSLWRRIPLPGKGPRALAVSGSKVFVAQYFSDDLAVIDADAGPDARVRVIALGKSPQLTQQRRGELLFNDATICFQQWQSCASCHPDARMDALSWDLMNDGVGNPKNTKSMLLAHQTPPAMAEGVRISAEDAVREGIRHILFSDRPEDEAAAIDAYLKTLEPVPSPHRVDGHLSPAAERGEKLFDSRRIGCARCHPAPFYTDLKLHNVGSRAVNERSERFDTPTLIESWRTAPYLHDGRYLTVKELLLEGRHGLHRDQHVSEQDLDDLVEFVLSL
jgi:YVTN family beta-propeller protein